VIVGVLFGRHAELRPRLRAAVAPELLAIEVASALLKYVRAGSLAAADAGDLVDELLRSPLELRPLKPLARAALEAAGRLGISVYDASYLVLAEREKAVLLTADRRLAAVAGRAQLVSSSGG
jgi:predicted nucleic acid-binding protein